MSASEEKIKIQKLKKRGAFRQPLFDPWDPRNYVLSCSTFIDKHPIDAWVYSESFKGCGAVIFISDKNEGAYFHIHPTQADRNLGISFIKETLAKHEIIPSKILFVTTSQTHQIVRQNFKARIGHEFPKLKIKSIDVKCSGANHCDLYYNPKLDKLVMLEHIGPIEEVQHVYDKALQSIPLIGNFFKQSSTVDKNTKYFISLIERCCQDVEISDKNLLKMRNASTTEEMTSIAKQVMDSIQEGMPLSKEVHLSSKIIEFLSKGSNTPSDKLYLQAKAVEHTRLEPVP